MNAKTTPGATSTNSPIRSQRFHLVEQPVTAVTLLQDAANAILDRAASRDVQHERSMARTVAAFNAITGHAISERDGWLFMACLKMARATAGRHVDDDYVDGAAYFGLAGETAHLDQLMAEAEATGERG